MPKQARRSWQPGLVVVIIAALGLAGFVSWYAFFSPITVSAASVETDVPVQVFGLGTIGARIQSNVGFKVAGLLVELRVDQGDHVHARQVLGPPPCPNRNAQIMIGASTDAHLDPTQMQSRDMT